MKMHPRTIGGGFRYRVPPENRASATPSAKTPPTTKPNQAERINNTMRNEMLKGKVFRSVEEVIAAVALAVDFYNNRWTHMSIGMMTPMEASESTGDRDMRWMSYRHLAIKSRYNLDISENSLPLPECQGAPSGLRPPDNP